ncbi:MAG: ABC transporter ATP-binding protein [Deltaproteobacteria bacterium]|nr:ABC transporter ATP-binding protein [Deltaproteobacteria bacterium]
MQRIGAPIHLVGLVKTFDQVRAVDGISLEISAGEFLTILGPSGSGKTTTLNLIAGFESPTSGHILIGKEDIAIKPPHKRNLGMVFQNYALFPHMTVFDNIAFPLKNRKVDEKKIRESVREVLALVQLEGYEKRYPKQMSGGQQQRVSLARSLAYKPSALLMDEPLGALDKKLRDYMQTEIKRIQREVGITVIYVTHDQEEALNMSDRIAVMKAGRIEQLDNPRDIYEHPQNLFVADFIGEANIVEGKVIAMEEAFAKVRVWDNLEMKALNINHKNQGTSVGVVIRPERIKLLPGSDVTDNCYTGTVLEANFVGQLLRYTVAVENGGTIFLKEHNCGQDIKGPGSCIRIGWNHEDCQVV